MKGQVDTLNTAEHATLLEAVLQGMIPKILILDLPVEHSSRTAGQIAAFKEVSFHRHAAAHQCTTVDIRGDVEKVVT